MGNLEILQPKYDQTFARCEGVGPTLEVQGKTGSTGPGSNPQFAFSGPSPRVWEKLCAHRVSAVNSRNISMPVGRTISPIRLICPTPEGPDACTRLLVRPNHRPAMSWSLDPGQSRSLSLTVLLDLITTAKRLFRRTLGGQEPGVMSQATNTNGVHPSTAALRLRGVRRVRRPLSPILHLHCLQPLQLNSPPQSE
jgi:hypothetical protein